MITKAKLVHPSREDDGDEAQYEVLEICVMVQYVTVLNEVYDTRDENAALKQKREIEAPFRMDNEIKECEGIGARSFKEMLIAICAINSLDNASIKQ